MTCKADVSKWLPGKIAIHELLDVPKGVEPGEYELHLALLDPAHLTPAIRLAIAGRADDGWYPLGPIKVTDSIDYPAWGGIKDAGMGYPYKGITGIP